MDSWKAWFGLMQTIYPIKQTNLTRDRPLQLLCLGLSRSGTKSLARALVQLGYSEVYHGQDVIFKRISDSPQWIRLAHAKSTGDPEGLLNKAQFDKLIGHCEAVTDVPTALFAEELIKLYPDAKVILNRRRDVEGWKKSMQKTMFPISRRTPWEKAVMLSHPQYSWTRLWWTEGIDALMHNPWLADDSRMLKDYAAHYDKLKAQCEKEGREYLEWYLEDGWGPLCKFLGKEVPDEDFPTGNTPMNPGENVVFPTWPDDSLKNMALAAATIALAVCGAAMQVFGLKNFETMTRAAGALAVIFVVRWVWQARDTSKGKPLGASGGRPAF